MPLIQFKAAGAAKHQSSAVSSFKVFVADTKLASYETLVRRGNHLQSAGTKHSHWSPELIIHYNRLSFKVWFAKGAIIISFTPLDSLVTHDILSKGRPAALLVCYPMFVSVLPSISPHSVISQLTRSSAGLPVRHGFFPAFV